ncbi:hypothetical protein [Psychroflexus planctonicus]|uniref:DUF2281 domain-containing protein n=1 Tax=Psychroflexus planctonicus TaxID=1526575 RepID=A0ABQ1SGS6_9FLAO|nr:hypothetical protein [Psychroflexus planctonicus]GGE32217.1 hypothetical protein GCM10010832_10610 [Psychroflexus planctonicus]
MNREKLIQQATQNLQYLPESKLKDVSDYVEYLLSKLDNQIVQKNIEQLATDAKTFDFLADDDDLYDESDLKERFK